LYAVVFATVLAIATRVQPHRIVYGVGALCLAGLLVYPLVHVYIQSTPAPGPRSPDVVAAFSAVPADYVRPGSGNPVYRAFLPRFVHAERALFPGLVPILPAAAGPGPPPPARRVRSFAVG